MSAKAANAHRSAAGFTLLELMVALAIFALIATMSYGGLTAVLDQRARADEQAEGWRELQMAVRIVTADLQQIHPRPVRDEIGNLYEAAFVAGGSAPYALQFTRGGWVNPAGLPRSTQQRVAYRLEEDRLLRIHWPVLDRTLGTEAVVTELLHGVQAVSFRMLDWNGQWYTQWPPPAAGDDLLRIPRAVEFSLQTAQYGALEFLVVSSP